MALRFLRPTRTVTLSNVEVRAIDNYGCNQWLHAVDDGGTYVVLSGEANGVIYVKLFDPDSAANDAALPGWTQLLSKSDIEFADPAALVYIKDDGSPGECNLIADHWHVSAHGYHWIACSLTDSTYSSEGVSVYLIKFTVDPTTGVPTPIDQALIRAPTSAVDDYTSSRDLKYPTNDLFLVPTANGVAIGILRPL